MVECPSTVFSSVEVHIFMPSVLLIEKLLPFNDPAISPTGLCLLIPSGWRSNRSLLFVYPDPFKHMSVLRNLPELLPSMHWALSCFAHWLISVYTISQQPLYTSLPLSMGERLAELDKHCSLFLSAHLWMRHTETHTMLEMTASTTVLINPQFFLLNAQTCLSFLRRPVVIHTQPEFSA